MSLTNVSFKYNVAKVIDTPWNTIINGLNYTKTNLTPLALKYTLCENYDAGMLLKEVAGNNNKSGVPIEDFSWNNSTIDYNDIDKYWICNINYNSTNQTGAFIYKAQRYTDENGFDYSIISNPLPTQVKTRNCAQIWYQDSNYLFIYYNDSYYSEGQSVYLRRYYKNKDSDLLEIKNTVSCTNGIMSLLTIKNGFIYYLKQFGTSSTAHYICSLEINTGQEKIIYSDSTSNLGVLTSYPTNINDNCFYLKDCPNNLWYKFTFDETWSEVTRETIPCDFDDSNFSSSGTQYIGEIKRFNHIYVEGENKYLVCITLNSYNQNTNLRSSLLQLYKISETGLKRLQSIIIDGFSLIPKNDWNNLFIGTRTGIRVFSWDPLNKVIIEKPSIFTTLAQFGFDNDERLWILDVEGNVFRYTYNQPITVDYHFEKERYTVGTDIIESYVKVRVLNYMGNYISSKIKIKAIGNFTFTNNKKELEIQLVSNEYQQLPIYINSTGKYEIRI